MELNNKVYILVEDGRRIIVVSDNLPLCDFYKNSFQRLFGYDRKLEIKLVDKDTLFLGTCLHCELVYRTWR